MAKLTDESANKLADAICMLCDKIDDLTDDTLINLADSLDTFSRVLEHHNTILSEGEYSNESFCKTLSDLSSNIANLTCELKRMPSN